MAETPDYNYLDKLNPQQREAVVYTDGPSLVIAGAGSGKTRVLTYKIIHLLRLGIEPWRIMALTFTNKAAREMKERIIAVVGEHVASRLWMGTFHSIFLRILRIHADLLGYNRNFTIYDAGESKSLVKMIIKELALDDKVYKASAIASAISNAKNSLITPEMYLADSDLQSADSKARRPMTGRIYKLYCQRCRIAQAMDFDDILVNMNILLRDFPDVREKYQDYFKYILVDEYQDTNFAQYLIISQLAEKRRRLCVVGDDAQSIYSFRGANIGNILNLDRKMPDLRIFKLERNYRSTQNIINAAGSLIKKNVHQMPKDVYSENEPGDKITVVKTYTDMEEAYTVANMLTELKMARQDSYDRFAVLYRTNAQSRILEESLRKRAIPYRIYGGVSFYQRKEIKDAICYFRLAVNPDDDEALRRVVNYPARGIGETTMRKLIEAATRDGVSIWRVIGDPDGHGVNINGGTRKKLQGFHDLISGFVADVASGSDAYATGQLVINRTGLLTSLVHENTPESISRQENIMELLSAMKEFTDLRREQGEENYRVIDFLSEVSLATDQDEQDDTDEAKVTLMTVHAAKGLEFRNVFIVGVEEELFPSSMAMTSEAEIEEERRLLYVAITRAEKECVITYAGTRFRNGQTMFTRPSRFLSDIDMQYLNLVNTAELAVRRSEGLYDSVNRYRESFGENTSHGSDERFTGISTNSRAAKRNKSSVSFDSTGAVEKESTSDGLLRPGVKVRHAHFGLGVVRKIESVSGSDVVTVDFGTLGLKKLLMKYAKLTVLE